MIKRVYQTIIINLIPSAHKRASYLRKHEVFASMGDNVSLQFRKIPLYPKLIKFHNNITVASNVLFVTHEATHIIMNRVLGEHLIDEYIGCIEVEDNCFIGANSIILPNVRIGPNAIVAAGSLVNIDVPAGEIWGGVPARCIGTFNDLLKKREAREYPSELSPRNQELSLELAEFMWNKFDDKRKNDLCKQARSENKAVYAPEYGKNCPTK